MPLAVAIQKRYLPFTQPADANRHARLTERRFNIPKFPIFQMLCECITQPRAAYNTNQLFRHLLTLLVKWKLYYRAAAIFTRQKTADLVFFIPKVKVGISNDPKGKKRRSMFA
jgi:hypothetical protein